MPAPLLLRKPALLALLLIGIAMPATANPVAPAPSQSSATHASAYLGGGCFWCLEAYFETLPGVVAVVSGYAGGRTAQPTYREVCSGTTGHAEVVRVDFDPTLTTYEALLEKFWLVHDPTSLNRQGPDEGSQYRSIILFADEAQRRAVAQARDKLQQRLADRVVTEIVPLEEFHEAEEYHQDYYRRNPGQGYCRMVIAPKLRKLGVK